MRDLVYGPTFAEMTSPETIPENLREAARVARSEDPLDPVNLFNIHWKDDLGEVMALVMPKELTGVSTTIAVLTGLKFPTGAHKVGPAYAITAEMQVYGEISPASHHLVFPSSGNFGIAGAWVGPRMGYESTVVVNDDVPMERVEAIRDYGAKVSRTRRDDPRCVTLQPFSEFGGYRFHGRVTAKAAEELALSLHRQGYGTGRVTALVSAVGSAGTIGAGDRLKEQYGTMIVGLEPIQCPTMYNVGFGAHRIEGIGDKHVSWIHNVLHMDALMCIDDVDTIRGMALLQEGGDVLVNDLGVPEEVAARFVGMFGTSGVCNVLGAIKTVKHFGLGPDDLVVTIATDGFDRYRGVARWLETQEGPQTRERALRRVEIFHRTGTDYVLEGTRQVRERWHNQKYFTWVEQQGKTVEALQMQRSPDFWREQLARVDDIDRKILAARG